MEQGVVSIFVLFFQNENSGESIGEKEVARL